MALDPGFIFSQGSLQDYVDCPRRFQLRYLLNLAWPAAEAEPVAEHEERMRRGRAFHRLVQQHALGIVGGEVPMGGASDEELRSWWRNYLDHGPVGLPEQRHMEIGLSTPLAGHRIVAKYDVIAIDRGSRAVIVDWKTSLERPKAAWLSARLQTRVYRYVLVRAGAHLNGGVPIPPGQVSMVYWFAEFPDEPETLRYDATQHGADGRYLETLIAEIKGLAGSDQPLAEDIRRCRFCVYRSLCDRGTSAGELAGGETGSVEASEIAERSWESRFDFDQISEIEL